MERFTKEREDQLKANSNHVVQELLSEITILTTEREQARENSNHWQVKSYVFEKERDRLKDRLEKLKRCILACIKGDN